MNLKDEILNRMLSASPTKLQIPLPLKKYIHLAMEEYYRAMAEAGDKMTRRRTATLLWAFFGEQTWEEFIFFLRTKRLKRVKRMVQKLSNIDNRKYYIVRSSDTGYKYFSSRDVKMNKKLRVFKSDVDVVKLHETADAVIYPKR